LATTAIKFEVDQNDPGAPAATGLSNIGGRSLIVFTNSEYNDEFPIPEYGRALVIGGSQGDIPLEGDVYEFPSLVIERRGENICAYSVAKEIPFYHNEQQATELRVLADGDVLSIANHQVLFNDPRGRRVPQTRDGMVAAPGYPEPQVTKSFLRGWGDEEAAAAREQQQAAPSPTPPLSSPVEVKRQTQGFGRIPFGQVETDRRGGLSGAPVLSGSLGGEDAQSEEENYTALEDKIIIGIGVLLLGAVMAVFVYWAFFF
jgi:hypothetical protein